MEIEPNRPVWSRARASARIAMNWVDAYSVARSGGHRAVAGVIGRVRRMVVPWFDPVVEIGVGAGRSISVPFSHDLPFILADHPGYADNLRRVLWTLADRRGGLNVIDIGANVGDSVVMTHRPDITYLAVEGLECFHCFLELNTRHLADVTTVLATVGRSGESLQYEKAAGSAGSSCREDSATCGPEDEPHVAMSIPDLIEMSDFSDEIDFVKIDTDGHDVGVILGSWSWITKRRPVLFFEYDPLLNNDDELTLLEMVDRLDSVGYHWALVYDETGNLVLGSRPSETMNDLDRYARLRGSGYWDVCLVPSEDEFRLLHDAEIGAPSRAEVRA